MPRLSPVTAGSPAPSTPTGQAADHDGQLVSSLIDTFCELTTGEETSHLYGTEGEQHALFEAIPAILEALEKRVSEQPEGAREPLGITVGNETITILESGQGLEIAVTGSENSRPIPGMDFGSLMQVLNKKISGPGESHGDVTALPESEGFVPTLVHLPGEIRRDIAARLSGQDAMALGFTSRAFYSDLGDDLVYAGSDLVDREGGAGLTQALDLLNEIPASCRADSLQGLAEEMPVIPSEERSEAFENLFVAAGSLPPAKRRELFGTLAFAARYLDDAGRETAWRMCVDEIDKTRIAPTGADSVMVNLIGSYTECLQSEVDRGNFFDGVLPAVAGQTANPGKGHALSQLAVSIAGLSSADRPAAFEAIQSVIVDLDSSDLNKGYALRTLAMNANLGSQAQFKAIADSVLELGPTRSGRSAALTELAKQMSETPLFGSDTATFKAVLQAVANLDAHDYARAGALQSLAQCIDHLPADDQAAARADIERFTSP